MDDRTKTLVRNIILIVIIILLLVNWHDFFHGLRDGLNGVDTKAAK